MGTSYALAGEFSLADEWLEKSVNRFQSVGDFFGASTSQMAQVYNLWHNASQVQALDAFAALVPILKNEGLGILLTRPTFLGLQEMQPLLPLIVEAYQKGIETRLAGFTSPWFEV